MLFHPFDNMFFRNGYSIDPDALAEILQVRGGEKASGVAVLLKRSCPHMAQASLAIGASNVNNAQAFLWVAQMRTEGFRSAQVHLVGSTSLALEHGQAVKEPFDGGQIGVQRFLKL